MTDVSVLPRPIQTFRDSVRPAQMMLNVYKLLDSRDEILTDGDFVHKIRVLVAANAAEDLLVVQNEIFLGIVREKAQLPRSELKRATLCHLLRQAVVASCSALDVYLPALLRFHLETIIHFRGRDFLPQDGDIKEYFAELTFDLAEVVRLTATEDAALYLANKMVKFLDRKYLSNKKGVHVVGVLLGLSKPWESIAQHLRRDKKELINVLEEAVQRRNDIVHRADRKQGDPSGPQQSISLPWTMQAVDTINHICTAFDEVVDARIAELRAGGSAA